MGCLSLLWRLIGWLLMFVVIGLCNFGNFLPRVLRLPRETLGTCLWFWFQSVEGISNLESLLWWCKAETLRKRPFQSFLCPVSKCVFLHNLSHENEFDLHENELLDGPSLFSYEFFCTNIRFDIEAKWNLETAYSSPWSPRCSFAVWLWFEMCSIL